MSARRVCAGVNKLLLFGVLVHCHYLMSAFTSRINIILKNESAAVFPY